MLPVDVAITRFRRDLTIAALLRTLLLAAAAACVLAGPVFGRDEGMIVLMVVGGIWVLLSYHSMQGTRIAADSPSLIAAGEFDRAESHIDLAVRSFSLFRTAKLLNLHHLALLRHAQHRWRESALLCQAVLVQKVGNLQGLARTTLLLLADSMLQLGDLKGAFDAMGRLYRYRLSLGEALTLQMLQLDYGSRIRAMGVHVAGHRREGADVRADARTERGQVAGVFIAGGLQIGPPRTGKLAAAAGGIARRTQGDRRRSPGSGGSVRP